MTVNLNLPFPVILCSSTSAMILRIVGCIGQKGRENRSRKQGTDGHGYKGNNTQEDRLG